MSLQRLEVVCLCILHLCGCFVSRTLGLDIDHWGTNFVFTFPRSMNGAQNMVVITAREMTEVRVTSHQTGAVTAFTLNEGEAKNVVYGSEVEATSSGIKLENLAISVAASNKVSVYAYSYDERYTEGMLVLPVPSLGIDYMVVNLYIGNQWQDSSTQTIIIAVDNDTDVNILFKFIPNSRCYVDHKNYYNGDDFDFILNEYDVLNINCASDNTGSRITSNKPIGVITGSRLLKLPIDSRIDPTMEMLPPVTEFGTQFSLIAPEGHTSKKSMLRVVPLNSGTSFEIKGELHTPLKGEAVDNYLTESEKICFNATDKVIVVIFMLGASYTNYYTGDVYMSLVPPVDKATNDYVVFNNVLKSLDGDYKGGINIVAQNSVKAEITPTLNYEQLCNDYYVYSKIMKSSRVNHYHAPSPFLLLIYGYSFREAFGFPAGMKLSDFSGADECASTPCQNGGWCIDTTTSFRCHCEDSRFTGTFCEIDDVDNCLFHQCQNGICVDVGSSYECICYADYTGDMCDAEIYYESTTMIPTTEHPTTADEPTTEHPTTTDVPTTEHPTTTDVPTTEHVTTTDVPTTEHATTTTDVPTTEHPTTTDVPTTEHTTTTTDGPTTEHPTTTADEPTTEHPTTTDVPTTEHVTTTDVPTTEHATTTTDVSTTEHPTTTDVPTTEHATTTTDVPTTEHATSTADEPTTEHPTTTDVPSTEHPTTTDVPTTEHTTTTTTDVPSTEHPTTTDVPTTEQPTTTDVPSTEHPTTTDEPTTEHPITTDEPTTEHPTTTDVPSTEHPTTTDGSSRPTEHSTTTDGSTTEHPTTDEPTTEHSTKIDEPTTEHPTTTDEPTTEHPTTTDGPTTEHPTTTDVPTTEHPTTTDEPTTVHPTTTTDVPSTEHPTTTTDEPTTEHLTTTDEPTTEHPTTTGVQTTEHPTTTGVQTTEHPTTTDEPTTEHPTTTGVQTIEHPTSTSTEHTAVVTLEISNNRTENQSDIKFLPIYFKYRACNGNPCMCKCPCNQVLNRTEVLVHAKEQQNQLLVEKKSLSKTVRRKKSSENLTTAETNLGLYTVVVIFIMVSGVVILDSIWFFAWLYEKIKQYKERDRRSTDEEVFEN